MLSKNSNDNDNASTNTTPSSTIPIRILALHGSEGSAGQFLDLVSEMASIAVETHHQLWYIDAINAPFAKGDGHAWWINPPGVRSYNAVKEYPGVSDSIQCVTTALAQAQHAIDLVVAHSQGAILTTTMLALQQPSGFAPPRYGYILNGGAWPNPYTKQLESLQFDQDNNVRILIIAGQADTINPPDTQQRVADALVAAGANVTVVTHPGGHGVPIGNTEAVKQILDWIAQGVVEDHHAEL